MKKYNLSNIMKRAWELVKKEGMTISDGLKKAWKEAKMPSKEQVIEKLVEMGANRWTKYGKDRIYFNTKDFINSIGIKHDNYNSGSICCATLNGEKISNSKCGKIICSLNDIWLNVDTMKLESKVKSAWLDETAVELLKNVIK